MSIDTSLESSLYIISTLHDKSYFSDWSWNEIQNRSFGLQKKEKKIVRNPFNHLLESNELYMKLSQKN